MMLRSFPNQSVILLLWLVCSDLCTKYEIWVLVWGKYCVFNLIDQLRGRVFNTCIATSFSSCDPRCCCTCVGHVCLWDRGLLGAPCCLSSSLSPSRPCLEFWLKQGITGEAIVWNSRHRVVVAQRQLPRFGIWVGLAETELLFLVVTYKAVDI